MHIMCDYIYAGFDDDNDARDDDADGYPTGQERRDALLGLGGDPFDPSNVPSTTAEDPSLWIDEDPLDGADNDGDGAIDEDQPGDNSDNDALWDEDPSDSADNDGDTYIDEDAPASGPPPNNGYREIWWSESMGIVVKQISVNAPYGGTENMELNTVPSP